MKRSKKVLEENDTSAFKLFKPGLSSMPQHIIEAICRHLLMQESDSSNPLGVRDLESVYGPLGDAPTSLLSLRATCRFLRDAIDQSFLNFSLNLSTLTDEKLTLEHIARNTNWKITVFDCTLHYPESTFLAEIDKYWSLIRDLFRPMRLIIKWVNGMYSFSHMRDVIDRFVSLNSNLRVQIELFSLPRNVLSGNAVFPEVDKLVLSACDQHFMIPENFIQILVKILPNVQNLDVRFHLRNFFTDKMVSTWNLRSLDLANFRDAQNVLATVAHLTIYALNERTALSVIRKTFVNLKSINIYQTFFRDRNSHFGNVFPDSCYSVGIPSYDLNLVQKCKSIQNLYLNDFGWSGMQDLLKVESELKMLVLDFIHAFQGKRKYISSLLEHFKCLEYLELIIDEWIQEMLYMVPGLPQYNTFINHINTIMLSHKINVILIRHTSRPGRLVFAKKSITNSELKNYADMCHLFKGTRYVPLFPLLSDSDECCLEDIFVGNSAGDYLRRMGVVDNMENDEKMNPEDSDNSE